MDGLLWTKEIKSAENNKQTNKLCITCLVLHAIAWNMVCNISKEALHRVAVRTYIFFH